MSTSNARHRSIGHHLRLAAADRGVDANRLRRSLVFQRALTRLGPAGLVLKGGYCLEVRFLGKARATKDVDLVGQLAATSDPELLRDMLDELLDQPGADGFTFTVGTVRRLRGEDAGAPAWRAGVTALVDGLEFERITIDLVSQVEETLGATEELVVAPPVAIPGLEGVVVRAVDVYQHAAEKIHAFSRTYAGDRPSSRVKDLVDLVLLIEAGLVGDDERLRERVGVVFATRDDADPPPNLPQPPGDWAIPYVSMAAQLTLTATTAPRAYDLVAARYAAALTEGTSQ